MGRVQEEVKRSDGDGRNNEYLGYLSTPESVGGIEHRRDHNRHDRTLVCSILGEERAVSAKILLTVMIMTHSNQDLHDLIIGIYHNSLKAVVTFNLSLLRLVRF